MKVLKMNSIPRRQLRHSLGVDPKLKPWHNHSNTAFKSLNSIRMVGLIAA